MSIGAVVLARLDSRRLPGKALRNLHDRPLIQYAFDVCVATRGIEGTVLATTDRREDDPLAAYAETQGIPCYRGAMEDVAGRFLAAMDQFGFDAAVRYNGDSPLNRPALLAEAVAKFHNEAPDLVTNVPGRTYPFGLSIEIVGRSVMRAACAAMTEARHREHVTQFFYDHPGFARTALMAAEDRTMSGIQLAVDTAGDLARMARIVVRLGPDWLLAPLAAIVSLAQDDEAGPT